MKSVIDERGNTTSYIYYSNGLLQGSCLNNDYGVIYNYNEYGELLSVSEARYNSSTQQMQAITARSDSQVTYSYNSKHELDDITLSNKVYSFEYDEYGNTVSVKVGNQSLSSYEYQSGNGHLNKMTYGNGVEVTYIYDALDRVAEIRYNNISKAKYVYSSNGQLSSIEDVVNNTRTVYSYNSDGKCILSRIEKDGRTVQSVLYRYDIYGRLSEKSIRYPYNTTENYENAVVYEYDENGRLIHIFDRIPKPGGFNWIFDSSSSYDNLGRLTDVTNTKGTFNIKDIYSYPFDEMTIKTSYLVDNVQTKIGSSTKNTSYTYDTKGNILSIVFSDTGKGIYYKYDDKNQLLREDNQPLNKTFSYQYDLCGNITSVSIYSYTRATNISTLVPNESYTYIYSNNQWGDLLTTLVHASSSGESTTVNLTYDAIGNPLSYYNGSNTFTFSWQNGRQLLGVQSGGSTIASYAYDPSGIRTSKVCGNTRYDYYFDGNRIVRELQTRADNGNIIKESRYSYDVRGNISSSTVFLYNSAGTGYTAYDFLFRTNIQGDVIGIYNSSGTCLADITYDAWGNFTYTSKTQGTEQTVASATPFRYRGYYYDTETGFYYLNSRYYDPQLKRFINADGYVNANGDLIGFNMFAYCGNNPVMCVDPNGDFAILVSLLFVTTLLVPIVINISRIESSVNYVDNSDVEAMDDEKYKTMDEENEPTYSLSREEKLSYIRKYREENRDNEVVQNWTEAEMLREFEYHDRGYKLVTAFGSDPNKKGSLAYRFQHVDFEGKQTFTTYACRFIGNCFFW